MAACSGLEEKPSSSKQTLPLKIFVEDAVTHAMRENCYSELTKVSKNNEPFSELAKGSNTGDLTTLSDDEFLHLLKEASTFNKPNNQESVLLKQLRKEVAETEPRENVNLESSSVSESSERRRHSKTSLCNETNSSALSCSISNSHHRTLETKKKQMRNRDDINCKNVSNADVFRKSAQQSQSLQDLLSPDSSRVKQKSQKTHRTLSLSEETSSIVSDSLSITSRTGKKANKHSSFTCSPKNELNKADLNKCNSPDYLGSLSLSLDTDDEKRKYESCPHSESLPYESITTECNLSVTNSKTVISQNSACVSPIEIEMEEIKSGKIPSKGKDLSSDREIEKNKNISQQSNSKFYVDCNDIDTTVTFPLKLVSSVDDQNSSINDSASDSLKRQVTIPMVPWPRPVQVQSFFSSLSMDTDTFSSRSEKQLLNADINGNPFSRSSRPSSLASFVSTTLLDYNNSTLMSESKNRKNKRLRNAVNKGVLSENIAGHRGEEDIDALLQYINSSDKKGKSSVKGNSPNQMFSNKNSILHENDKKKSFGKDIKNCNKNMINTVKKKLTRSNSLENLISNNNLNKNLDVFSFKSVEATEITLKNSKSANLENSDLKILDINSNVQNHFTEINEKNKDTTSTDESSYQNSSIGQSSPEMSSFAADFYSTADVSSQTVEESGFLIVKKKQRKKHQGKRSESYRWRTAQNQRKKGMMLPLAESKCGKQDSRRKSTSSVPHSEHSSADNSDLDSVHSLPVRGSVPHPTQPHPHTTPSSSSSTPQASYADIAKMPISKLNSPSPCIITYSSQTSMKQQIGSEPELKKLEGSANGFQATKKRSDFREAASVANKGTAHIFVPEKDICSSDVKIRTFAKSTREINTQTEPETADVQTLNNENLTSRLSKKNDETVKGLCSVCLCPAKKSNCCCPKSHIYCSRQTLKNADIPPVIMDNMPSESNTCNVSFGFGIEEVLQMAPSRIVSSHPNPEIKDLQISNFETVLDSSDSEVLKSCIGITEILDVNNENAKDSSLCKSSLSLDVVSIAVNSSDFAQESPSHLKTVCYGVGRNLCYSETKVNTKKFNLSELANFLGAEFQCIEKEMKGISKHSGSRVMYYMDSTKES